MSKSPSILLLALASTALTLAACADTPLGAGLRSSQSASASGDDSSVYGLFLAGTAAADQGREHEATDYFARAADKEGDVGFLKERAFRAALAAGDVHRAAGLAPAPDESSLTIQRLGRLTRIVDALADGHGRDAQTLLAAEPLGPPHHAAGLLLAPWAAAAAGDWKAALTLPDAQGDRLAEGIALMDQALLFERSRRYDEADAAFRKLLAQGDGAGNSPTAYGAVLERRGRRADALGIYDAALKGDATNRLVKSMRDHAAAGKPAPAAPTIAEGAAQALLAPAAVFLAEKEQDMGLAYLRLVLRLDPNRAEAWLRVGDTLIALGEIDAARLAYGHLTPASPDYVDARALLMATYQKPEDAPVLLALAQDAVKAAPGDQDAQALLADALRVSERYADSAKVLDGLIASQGDKAGWQLYYMRGVALTQAGDWPNGERDLKKALELKPDDAEVLNYLGYSWVDRGIQLEQGKAMIEKAVATQPDSGAIVDSLGWAYYRLGDYQNAVAQLERAAELEPADADINNHLGDAYWRVGRRTEAHFQWDRVLTLDPDAKLRAEVEAKLKSGLDSDGKPAPSGPIASR